MKKFFQDPIRQILAFLFFLSGFCSLLYQVVWLRKAFAIFGIITPVISIVVSTFMLGLALGSWWGGNFVEQLQKDKRLSPGVLYAIAEFVIGLGGFVVPLLFRSGNFLFLSQGEANSLGYLILSAIVMAIAILPWCFCMGTTFPFMMSFIKKIYADTDEGSFSFLYTANVIGAMFGAALSAGIFIELFGFTKTLYVAAAVNFIIAILSFVLSRVCRAANRISAPNSLRIFSAGYDVNTEVFSLSVLFMTGFCSMAMEVVWTRAFTPVVRTTIYAFAFLLVLYLLGTWIGSCVYRQRIRQGKVLLQSPLLGLGFTAICLSLVLNDPRFGMKIGGIILSIIPFCTVLGFLTPGIIDRHSQGKPALAGRAYAINIVGCILGPLASGYIFLPYFGVKFSILILSLPFLIFFLYALIVERAYTKINLVLTTSGSFLLVLSFLYSITYEDVRLYANGVVRRDHTATVISEGSGLKKRLLVNGVGITSLTPICKIMAHLPVVLIEREVKNALVICFGMGTTFRSLMSWKWMKVDAVELVPSVKDAFTYYFIDAKDLLADRRGKIIIDDGRRYLQRATKKYDLITVDPPPPMEAAGSSLLYSLEYYALIKSRLAEDGILQQWVPGGEEQILQAVARSFDESFPYKVVFRSVEDWGYHLIGSMKPIKIPTSTAAAVKMPPLALKDMMEWTPGKTPVQFYEEIFSRRIPLAKLLQGDRSIYISDDRPYNEYYKVRRSIKKLKQLFIAH